jgi:hypothetical protein
MSAVAPRATVAQMAIVCALTLTVALTGCGRQTETSSDQPPTVSNTATADPAAQTTPSAPVDLTEIESQLTELDTILNQSTSDLSDAKDAESQEQ